MEQSQFFFAVANKGSRFFGVLGDKEYVVITRIRIIIRGPDSVPNRGRTRSLLKRSIFVSI